MGLLQEFVFLTFMVHQLFAEFVAPGTEFPPPRHRRTARLCKPAQFRWPYAEIARVRGKAGRLDRFSTAFFQLFSV